jgi:hypothetical protein
MPKTIHGNKLLSALIENIKMSIYENHITTHDYNIHFMSSSVSNEFASCTELQVLLINVRKEKMLKNGNFSKWKS